jgi:hypothetical protein
MMSKMVEKKIAEARQIPATASTPATSKAPLKFR